MQKILVTGANGFIGSYLIHHLHRLGFHVIASGRGITSHTGGAIIYEVLDFTKEEQVKSVFKQHEPAIVIHAGAMSKPDDCHLNKSQAYLINVEGTKLLLKYAVLYNSKFIFLSTDFVFDGRSGNYKEDDERAAVNYYGETKIISEDLVMNYEGPWSIVRTVLVYGIPILARQNLLTMVADHLLQGKSLKIFGDQVRTPTFVEDLVAAIIEIIKKNKQGIFHVSGKDVRTPYQMAMETAAFLELDQSLITEVEESDFDQPARRPLKTGFDISKAIRELDYEPTSFDEGLKKTLEKYKK
jgi:dTDP-4-dehydrorhamnose reductase